MNKELKEKFKELKRRKKIYQKYLKQLQRIVKNEAYWLNWLIETRLPYLRHQHAAYKRALRELNKSMPDCMCDTQAHICEIEYELDRYDREILDLTLKEILKKEVSNEEIKD